LLVPEFARLYPGAERRALSGALDKGDLLLPGAPFIVEVKNVSRTNLAGWAAESEIEAANAGVPYWVFSHKRVGKGKPADQWLTTTVGQFLGIIEAVREGCG
jgi:hypothetical protein